VLSRPAKLSLPDFFVSVFTLLATKVSKGVISQWNGFIVDILVCITPMIIIFQLYISLIRSLSEW